MKLRNKKTGEIVNAMDVDLYTDVVYLRISKDGRYDSRKYGSLAELNAEWEDYEEPKEYYCIDWTEPSGIYKTNCIDERDAFNKEIGNYFSSREEAEKAVEKLKAWKRLKDKGFRFLSNKTIGEYGSISYCLRYPTTSEEDKDLDLLFGGGE